MELVFLAPATLHRRVEPYKRLLGILLRPTCVSVSVSNHYLSLAEPAGAILLRSGRVPERTLSKLLKPYSSELTGVVIGSEAHTRYKDLLAVPEAADTLRQVQGVLHAVSPGIPAAWWDRWTPDTPGSCRLNTAPNLDAASQSTADPVAAAAEAAGKALTVGGSEAEAGSSGPLTPPRPAAAGGSKGGQCSMGTLFLQHYLDNLGALNTFG